MLTLNHYGPSSRSPSKTSSFEVDFSQIEFSLFVCMCVHSQIMKVGFFIEFRNAAGAIFSIFFISVVLSAVEPLICYEHPSGSENGSSMRSEPAVLCWEGAQTVAQRGYGPDGSVAKGTPLSLAFLRFPEIRLWELVDNPSLVHCDRAIPSNLRLRSATSTAIANNRHQRFWF